MAIDANGARMMVGGRTKGGLRENATFYSRVDREGIRGDDFYETPPEATRALLAVEKFLGPIWEPACGDGAIARVLEEAGYAVVGTDLCERKYGRGRVDFLMETKPLAPNIVTNPPYKNSLAFARKSTELCSGKVAFLMRLVWLEGAARKQFFEQSNLARVWVFSKRIPRMHRHGYDGPKTSSTIAFAWFVWDREHAGPAQVGWL